MKRRRVAVLPFRRPTLGDLLQKLILTRPEFVKRVEYVVRAEWERAKGAVKAS